VVAGDAVMGHTIGAGDSNSSGLGKCHTIQVVITCASACSRDILQGSVQSRGLVAHQDTVGGCQIGRVLIVPKGILVFEGGPKSSIPASVGTFQKGECKSVITGEAFEYTLVSCCRNEVFGVNLVLST